MSSRALLAALLLALAALIAILASSRPGRERARATPRRETSAEFVPGASAPREIVAAPEEALAAGAQRATATAALTGRVIDVESGQGAAGFWAQCSNAGQRVGEAGSDAAGYFQLRAPLSDGANELDVRVSVQAPWGWKMLTEEQRVDPRADGSFDELVFRARPARFGKLRAKLVDAFTRELVPDYMLRVGTDEGSREQVVTDAGGVFATEREYSEGTLMLFFHDIETSLQGANEEKLCYRSDVEHDPRVTEPVTIPIPVGPTYPLELDAPPAALKQHLFARLQLNVDQGAYRVSSSDAQVRGEEARWVRFRPGYYFASTEQPWKLCIASVDGLWFGSVPVQSTRGIHSTPVAIRLEARGQVLGRLRDREGEPIGQALVTLTALGAGRTGDDSEIARSGGNGLFSFELLRPGNYVVTAISVQHSAARADVTVRGGERAEVELVLERAPIAGAIAGRLVATTQPIDSTPRVLLSSLNPGGRSFSQAVPWKHEREQWIAEFRFDALPAGDYEVRLSYVDVAIWTPRTLRVSAPAEGLEFRQVPASSCVSFEAFEADGGRKLPECTAVLLSSGANDDCWTIQGEWDCIDHAGELDGDARWIVAAADHAPHWGTSAELVAVEGGFASRATLQPGWGLELVVLGPGLAPIAGAQVRLDGELAGATERDGTLRLVRERRPERVEVVHRDWKLDSTSLDELRAALHHGFPRAVVLLSPP